MRSLGLALLTLFFSAFSIFSAEKPAPLLTEIAHSPQQPHSGDALTITATIAAAPQSLTLEYQIIEPGKYIALTDPAFRLGWRSMRMEKFHSENRFSAQIPASVQSHRRLIRYRFKGEDSNSTPFLFPAKPSPESEDLPNFAYFVYDGTPTWNAAINPNTRDR